MHSYLLFVVTTLFLFSILFPRKEGGNYNEPKMIIIIMAFLKIVTQHKGRIETGYVKSNMCVLKELYGSRIRNIR